MKNYSTERQEIKKSVKKRKIAIAAILVAILIFLCIFSSFVSPRTWKYYFNMPSISSNKEGELRMHYIDVGEGDCTLLEFPDHRTMLIDGGDGSDKTELTILRYLNALKIKKLDFILLTHTDSDHAGGLDKVLAYKSVETIYLPKIDDYSINTEYAEVMEAVRKKNVYIEYSQIGKKINSKDKNYPYSLVFLSPDPPDNPIGQYATINGGNYTESDINDTSAVARLEYAGVSALFCGDATQKIENRLLLEDKLGVLRLAGIENFTADILKVAHHGSESSSSLLFLQKIGVKTAVISCGKNNSYGHPNSQTLDNLHAVEAEIFRTDEDGTVMITLSSDGKYKTQVAK